MLMESFVIDTNTDKRRECMKNIIITIFALLLLVISSTIYAANDLVLHLSFDEGAGQIAADASGFGNDCSFMGNPQWIGGQFGKAMEFDGATWGEIPHDDSLNLTEGLTISTWVILYGGGEGIQSAAEKGSAWIDGEYNLAPLYNGGTILQMKDLPADCADQNVGSNIQDNTWHFLTGTWDGQVIKLYIDGSVDAEMACAGTLLTNDEPMFIGARGGSSRFMIGALDELKIYNYALSEEEIMMDMEDPHNATAVKPDNKLAITWGEAKTGF
ncbi:hypothetical protein GF312_11385 [Candidatus Poribacteria bacterium]|nr:hypothetical protein [Candidatus Poribacteria bacterium]